MHRLARKCILLFLKAPIAGSVKTRLADRLNPEAALALYMGFGRDFLAVLESAGFAIRIYYDPPGEPEKIVDWLGTGFAFYPQSPGDLGKRMLVAFDETFAAGYSHAVLVGSDIPDLPVWILNEAFERLDQHPAVIGPSTDGGYYLIGFTSKGLLREAFDGIAWSTDRVLAETLNRFRRHDRAVHILPQWRDIDTYEDLKDLCERLRGHPDLLPNTRRILNRLSLLPDAR